MLYLTIMVYLKGVTQEQANDRRPDRGTSAPPQGSQPFDGSSHQKLIKCPHSRVSPEPHLQPPPQPADWCVGLGVASL